MAKTELEILINAKDNASKTFNGVNSSLSKFAKTGLVAVGTGLAAAGASLAVFAKKSVDAFGEAEVASKRLDTLLKNVKGSTAAQADELRNLSDSLERLGVVNGDALIAGQSQLATFQLQADSIKTLTPALADLAVATQGVNQTEESLISLGNLVGKAMTGQTEALSRYGVILTDAQRKTLELGTEQERAGALAEALKMNFGGLNEGLRATTEGGFVAMKNAIGNLMEEIGRLLSSVGLGGLLSTLTGSVNKMTDFLKTIESGKTIFDDIKNRVSALIEAFDQQTGVVTFAREMLATLYATLTDNLIPAFQNLWNALQPIMPYFEALAKFLGAAFLATITTITFVLGNTLALALNATAKGINLVADGIRIATEYAKPFIETLTSIVNWLSELISKAAKAFSALSKLGGGGSSSGSDSTSKKASGGTVVAGKAYTVGEQGQEMFVPNTTGRIIPNHQLGNGGTVVNVYMGSGTYVAGGGMQQLARMVGEEFMTQLRFNTQVGL